MVGVRQITENDNGCLIAKITNGSEVTIRNIPKTIDKWVRLIPVLYLIMKGTECKST